MLRHLRFFDCPPTVPNRDRWGAAFRAATVRERSLFRAATVRERNLFRAATVRERSLFRAATACPLRRPAVSRVRERTLSRAMTACSLGETSWAATQ